GIVPVRLSAPRRRAPPPGRPKTGSAADRACGHGSKPQELQHKGGRLRLRYLRAQPRKMAAGDVPALMRNDADHLVRRLRFHECAGMHEHVVTVDHEGVETAVVDNVNIDALRAEAGGGEDRL